MLEGVAEADICWGEVVHHHVTTVISSEGEGRRLRQLTEIQIVQQIALRCFSRQH